MHPEDGSDAYARAQYDPDKVASAIEASHGNLTQAARRIGCARSTVYEYVDQFEECEVAVDEGRERFVDEAENALLEQVRDGDTRAIKFALQCLGKHRGFTPKEERDIKHEGNPAQPVVLQYPNDSRRRDTPTDDD